MFEKASYELPDLNLFMDLAMKGIRENEKTYGPVYSVKLIGYALWFIAQKTGEKVPQDIKTLDQLEKYLLSVSDKYSTPYCALTYGQIKTESILQGQIGAGTHVESLRISKNILEAGKIKVKNFQIDDALLKIRQAGVAMKIVPSEMGYRKNSDESVDLLFSKCYLLDGCPSASEEDLLKRLDGGIRCGLGERLCRLFKLFTNYEWDYTLLEFNKPYCITRCYMF